MSLKTIIKKAAAVAGMSLIICLSANAQAGSSYAPYSLFGVGDVFGGGTAYNNSMAGVGVATRTNRFINPLNPASVTERDSLAFMADYSLYLNNKIFTQNGMHSANNLANIGDLIVSFPIYKSSAMMVGVLPVSATGYGYRFSSTTDDILAQAGDITYSASGNGAIYQLFASAGVTFWDRISLGAQGSYYFGQTTKNYYQTISDNSYIGLNNTCVVNVKSFGAKFGVQYEQPIGKGELILGATYALPVLLGGDVNVLKSYGSVADTVSLDLASLENRITVPSSMAVGVSYRYADKWMVEADYSRSDWTNANMNNVSGFAGNLIKDKGQIFQTTLSESYRIGFEYVPNRSDIRYYFKKCAYRAGAYYKNEYYTLDGNDITSKGITIGMTLPVFRWYNGITVGLDLGQRGSARNNLIRENYFNINLGVNIFDIWFQKPKYE